MDVIKRKACLLGNAQALCYLPDRPLTWMGAPFWGTLTMAENVVDKSEAERRWRPLKRALKNKYPEMRMVVVWARQKRGAWHLHWLCDARVDVNWLRPYAVELGWGPQIVLVALAFSQFNRGRGIQGVQRAVAAIVGYLTDYLTAKNSLDVKRDRGVRRVAVFGVGARVWRARHEAARGKRRLVLKGWSAWTQEQRERVIHDRNFPACSDDMAWCGFNLFPKAAQYMLLKNDASLRRWFWRVVLGLRPQRRAEEGPELPVHDHAFWVEYDRLEKEPF